jgi:uncharacterized protein (DUF1499 family)
MKIAALVIASLIVLFAISLVVQNMKSPTHLGHKDGKLAAMPSKPNAVSSQTEQTDKKVAALPFKGDAQATLAKVNSVLAEMANNEVQVKENNYIYTIFTTPTMHYHDDVEVLLDESAQLVHFRSQSRAGYSDMGLNRKRYEKFSKLYSL